MGHNHEQPAREPFELDGGALCLDFANTWGNHADPGSDRLRSYGMLIAFARQTGSLSEDATTTLARAARDDAIGAAAALDFGLELRTVIFHIFSSHAGDRDVRLADVNRINSVLGEALSHRRLERRGKHFVWEWTAGNVEDLHAPIWPVVESAASLLTSGDLDRVRECNADDCNWLFLDRSRNATRRWCSMSSCGNRAKARRRYRRQRER